MSTDIDFSDIDSLAAQLDEEPMEGELIQLISVGLLQRGKYQPRRKMSEEGLQELAESIKEQDVIQPIIIRPINDTRYEIVAGERRWRAAQIAGKEKIPAIVRELDDLTAQAVALIENIDREDMDFSDEIMGVAALASNTSQAKAAKILGKKGKNKKTYVAKCVKIAGAPDFVIDFLECGYSEDINAFYDLCFLADEQPEEAQALIERWDIDPTARTSLRKQVELARKGEGGDEVKPAITEDEKQAIMDSPEMDMVDSSGGSVSHGKHSEEEDSVADSPASVSHGKHSEEEEPPMILKSAVLLEDGRLVLYTNEGELTFEVGDDAKDILRKAING